MEDNSQKSEEEIVREKVTALLNQALKDLKKARKWSKLDLVFEGGWIATSKKRNYMMRAKQPIAEALRCMENYGREYKSIAYGLGIEGLNTTNNEAMYDYQKRDGYIDYTTYEKITGIIEIIENVLGKVEELPLKK